MENQQKKMRKREKIPLFGYARLVGTLANSLRRFSFVTPINYNGTHIPAAVINVRRLHVQPEACYTRLTTLIMELK